MRGKTKFRLKFLFQEVDLAPGEFLIGRSPSCNLTLEDPLVSRKHARILTTESGAVLDDLGSRNGTLVNGEPVFEGHRLANRDRIRVGGHEMVFIEERRYHSRPMRSTGAMTMCPSCKVPIAAGASTCPHCNAPIIPDERCDKCKQVVSADDVFCSRCGASLTRREDSTIPVELGGASAGWTSVLVGEVIGKAIAAGKHEQAESLLQGKIDDFENRAARGVVDVGRLVEIGSYAIELAAAQRSARLVEWLLDAWTRAREPMPLDTLVRLERSTEGWHDPRPALLRYLGSLDRAKLAEDSRARLDQISKHLRKDEGA